jgi:hypothetical protein
MTMFSLIGPTPMPLTFNLLLHDAGVEPSEVRLLRHQDGRSLPGLSPYELWRDDRPGFDLYQACQNADNRARLTDAHWASFVVSAESETLFAGLYRAEAVAPLQKHVIMPTTGSVQAATSCDFHELKRAEALAEYIGRVVIDWGPGVRTWIQHADNQDKPILELRRSFHEPAFPGYLELIISLSQVTKLPRSWATALGAGRGIYLLTCPKTKEQYVGSASGEGGFLKPFAEYAATGHGGNVALKSREPSDYQIAILEIAGSATTEIEILAMESRWKAKLQTREMGLDHNESKRFRCTRD